MEGLDRDDLVTREERNLRRHGKQLRKEASSRDTKKYSFPQRCVDVRNGLKREVMQAGTVSELRPNWRRVQYHSWKVRTARS